MNPTIRPITSDPTSEQFESTAGSSGAVEKSGPTSIRVLNQMAGPMTWELIEDLAATIGRVDLLTGHPDTLAKGSGNGIQIHRARPYHRGSNLGRFLSWLGYTFHAAWWLLRRERSAPLLVFTNPPIVIWMCWLLNRLFGLRYAVMVHDIYPDTVVRMGVLSPNSTLAAAWRLANRLAYERAEAVMTLGNHMANHLGRQFDPAKTTAGELLVVEPWADVARLDLSGRANWFAERHRQTDKLTVMYSGNMGRGHDIESLLTATEAFTDDPSIAFMFIGAGPKWKLVDEYVARRRPGNITLLPWQSESELPFTLSTASLGVVSLEPELTGLAVPSKAFYFLAAGVPVLGICESETELADTINQFGCGRVTSPGCPDDIVEVIRDIAMRPDLLEQWRQGAREARQHFSRSRNTQRFLTIVHDYLLETSVPRKTPSNRPSIGSRQP